MSHHHHHDKHHHHVEKHHGHHDIHTHSTTAVLVPTQTQQRQFRLTRVSDGTIAGQDLRVRETKMIAQKLQFQPNEEIEIMYSRGDDFEKYFELHDQIFVGLTNFRIFKIEKGSITQTYLQEIVSVSHQKNGIFSWDKVDCKLRNGQNETFGIYEGKTCAFFVQHVQNHINKRPQQQQNGHHHHDHCAPSTTTIIYPNGGTGMVQPIQPMQPQFQPMQPQYQPIPQQQQYPNMQPQYQPMQPGMQPIYVQPGYGSGAPNSNPPAYAPQ